MKYIVTTCPEHGEEIFTFPDCVHHVIMADAVGYMKDQNFGAWERVFREVISAGFIEGRCCVGGSESLSMKSRPQDTAILEARK